MSSIIKTHTMFTDPECLAKAIESTGVKIVSRTGSTLVTDLVDFFGPEKFVLENGRYVFVHDSYADRVNGYLNPSTIKGWKSVGKWLSDVDSEYMKLREEKKARMTAEELAREKHQMEKLVQDRRTQIVKKAKDEGYSVQETEEEGKIRLVLVRNTY